MTAAGEQYFHDRVRELSRRVEEERSDFDPDAPDGEEAMRLLREGFGPAVSLYVEARTGGRMVRFGEEEFGRLEDAMNAYLDLYARCYGAETEHMYSVREAAELLVETRNVRDTAEVLTGVP